MTRPPATRRRGNRPGLLAAVSAALVAASVLPVMAGPASAQTAEAYIDGAEPWTESACAGSVPIVVGSDTAAQSDIYSAVTLAGVVGTECVILAGPRDADMPADQRARLDAAAVRGWVVGGTAAVPDTKFAGRDMSRIAGKDRWTTAQRVGTVARSLGGGDAPVEVPLDASLSIPADVAQPGVHLGGAAPWIASNCDGDMPIVVGSDAKAQSDIYSAITLAGVMGTHCVILAGPRNGPMPPSQQARLEAAAEGGFVLGGTVAVPTAKIAGRDMTRLGGDTRWATAQLVGRRASGDTTAGNPTANEPTDNIHAVALTRYTAISAGWRHSCAVRTSGTVTCWGHNSDGKLDAPSGPFTAVSAGGTHSCGLRTDGTVTCWGDNSDGKLDAPSGPFTAVSAGSRVSCGVRTSGTVTCWGDNRTGDLDAPSGKFTAVSAGSAHACGLRTDGTVTCWGWNDHGQADAPSGKFTAVSAGGRYSCGLRSDNTVTCWGVAGFVVGSGEEIRDVPSGAFSTVTAGPWEHACGLRTDGTVTCWAGHDRGMAQPPSGPFTAVSAGWEHSCGLRADGTIDCWDPSTTTGHGAARTAASVAPSGKFTAVSAGWEYSCGVRGDGSVACWGAPPGEFARVPSGKFTAVSAGLKYACGVRTDGTATCWHGRDGQPSGKFTAVSAGNRDACGVRINGTMACWGWHANAGSEAPSGKFTAVSVGGLNLLNWYRTACGLRTDGTVTCWGHNSDGQADAPLGTFTAVSVGDRHACGVRTNGTATCWGRNRYGELDAPSGKFAAISAGRTHSCGLSINGTAMCWGSNRDGQVDAPTGQFIAISAGTGHSCGVRSDGSVTCWGDAHSAAPIVIAAS